MAVMSRLKEDVYCTLLLSDSYLPGAAVLANSLRDAGTTKKLAVLVTMETLSADTIAELTTLYDYVIPVERMRTPNLSNLYVMGRPDLSYAFTKIALWRQTQFRKIVYLDADVVALRALDELFDIQASFAAAPDIGWPDAFNSGVMVITPNMGEYWALQTMAATGDSFDGADQGLLNQYFEHRPWQRLKFTYNCTPNAEYQWEPAYRYYKRDISAIHFVGKNKPWSGQQSGGSGVYGELLARWWAVHNRHLNRPKAIAQSEAGVEGDRTTLNTIPATAAQPEASAITTEPPITDHGDLAANIDQNVIEPTPTSQQRKFSAPEMEWDATRSGPPTDSRPEAANFPSQTYTFSESPTLFKAPQDMGYKVPENKPEHTEMPKPIFPWEQEPDRPRATRVFAEDAPPEPTPSISSPTHAFSTVHYNGADSGVSQDAGRVDSTGSISPSKSADEQWQAFQSSNVNAWDRVPGIENYVRAIVDLQGRRGKTESLEQTTGTDDISSPLVMRRNRRSSLILTDFPSAVERPSLPVTPAPLRRPSFWGDERNEQGELPSATGVPEQQEWNPLEKLDELRRSSVIEFEHLKKDEHPDPPLRALPEHSAMKEQGISNIGLGEADCTTGLATEDHNEPADSTTTQAFHTETPTKQATSEATVPDALPQQPGIVEGDSGSNVNRSGLGPAGTQPISFQQPSLSAGQQVQAGDMTFTLPSFADSAQEIDGPAGYDTPSLTQTQE
ncbi:hypothetical protein IAQ61_010998 [Plenodomus lingam]|uniref:uncharacterized protein n=1 Tax=Leptosphaeria maculans TaxID=5022 RepID=UPI0033283E0B|nr:hypothetical protein IAQ61_010998 [Plenodomus lingam]